jgi:hypothetical protein
MRWLWDAHRLMINAAVIKIPLSWVAEIPVEPTCGFQAKLKSKPLKNA